MNLFKRKFQNIQLLFTKKIENPCRAPKVIVLTSRGAAGGQVGGHRGSKGQRSTCC